MTTAVEAFREQRLVEVAELGELWEDWLAAKTARTQDAYASDLRQFAAYVKCEDWHEACQRFVTCPGPTAHKVVLGWKASMKRRGMAPATINRRISALRNVARLGRAVGLCNFELEVEGEKVIALRDTRGPGLPAVRAMIAAAEADDRLSGVRDAAILRWLYYLALRRIEVVRLDVGDYQPSPRTPMAQLHRKGKDQRTAFAVDVRAARALDQWLEVSGQPKRGPLFPAFTRGKGRLDVSSINRLVTRRAIEAGFEGGRLPAPDNRRITPHGIRHTVITIVAQETGSLLAAQELAGHEDPRTTRRYFDNLGEGVRDAAGVLPDL